MKIYVERNGDGNLRAFELQGLVSIGLGRRLFVKDVWSEERGGNRKLILVASIHDARKFKNKEEVKAFIEGTNYEFAGYRN